MAEQEALKEKPVEKAAPKVEAKPEPKPVKEVKEAQPVKAEAKPVKAEAKPAKAEVKPEAKAEKKEVKPAKPKKAVKPKANNDVELTETVLKRRKLIKKKVSLPTFRGRFGIRSIRKKSISKWNKWRKPRGIDIKRRNDDGAYPKTGYSTDLNVKDLHPSGFEDILVKNLQELTALNPKEQAARIGGTVGRKKKKDILAKAKELKIKVLNR
jgi:large subunit ribosomal protein L32e